MLQLIPHDSGRAGEAECPRRGVLVTAGHNGHNGNNNAIMVTSLSGHQPSSGDTLPGDQSVQGRVFHIWIGLKEIVYKEWGKGIRLTKIITEGLKD